MVKFNEEFLLLREKYIGLVSTDKLKRNIGDINIPFTGNCYNVGIRVSEFDSEVPFK